MVTMAAADCSRPLLVTASVTTVMTAKAMATIGPETGPSWTKGSKRERWKGHGLTTSEEGGALADAHSTKLLWSCRIVQT